MSRSGSRIVFCLLIAVGCATTTPSVVPPAAVPQTDPVLRGQLAQAQAALRAAETDLRTARATVASLTEALRQAEGERGSGVTRVRDLEAQLASAQAALRVSEGDLARARTAGTPGADAAAKVQLTEALRQAEAQLREARAEVERMRADLARGKAPERKALERLRRGMGERGEAMDRIIATLPSYYHGLGDETDRILVVQIGTFKLGSSDKFDAGEPDWKAAVGKITNGLRQHPEMVVILECTADSYSFGGRLHDGANAGLATGRCGKVLRQLRAAGLPTQVNVLGRPMDYGRAERVYGERNVRVYLETWRGVDATARAGLVELEDRVDGIEGRVSSLEDRHSGWVAYALKCFVNSNGGGCLSGVSVGYELRLLDWLGIGLSGSGAWTQGEHYFDVALVAPIRFPNLDWLRLELDPIRLIHRGRFALFEDDILGFGHEVWLSLVVQEGLSKHCDFVFDVGGGPSRLSPFDGNPFWVGQIEGRVRIQCQ